MCQRISSGSDVKESSLVGKKRINASSRVVAAAGIVSKRSKTSRRVLLTRRILIERTESSAGVPDPSGEVGQDANTFALLPGGMLPSVSGPTACARGASPRQTSRGRMRRIKFNF